MVNLPLDVLMYFFFAMDIEMIENNLDTKASYAGKDFDTFIADLKDIFAQVQAAGVHRLSATMGHKPGNPHQYFGFEAKNTSIRIPITFEVLEDGLSIASIQDDTNYIKDKDVRSTLTI